MRQLTEYELKLVTGANGSTVYVTGDPADPYDPGPWYPGQGDPWGGGGGGGGGGGSEEPPPETGCSDTEAVEATSQIAAKTNDTSREYGSIIYRAADGSLQHSPPLGGTLSVIPLSTWNNWLSTNGISWSQVVGTVHNHPYDVYADTQAEADINRYPSSNDWGFADYAIGQGADADQFSLYIIDTQGIVRDFSYSDSSVYRAMGDEAKDDGENLPAKTETGGCS